MAARCASCTIWLSRDLASSLLYGKRRRLRHRRASSSKALAQYLFINMPFARCRRRRANTVGVAAGPVMLTISARGHARQRARWAGDRALRDDGARHAWGSRNRLWRGQLHIGKRREIWLPRLRHRLLGWHGWRALSAEKQYFACLFYHPFALSANKHAARRAWRRHRRLVVDGLHAGAHLASPASSSAIRASSLRGVVMSCACATSAARQSSALSGNGHVHRSQLLHLAPPSAKIASSSRPYHHR